jgi:hypothetical protein
MFSKRLLNIAVKSTSVLNQNVSKTATPSYISRNFSSTHSGEITLKQAKEMPKCYTTMSNDIIVILALSGDQAAREERLIREIMSVDNKSWSEAEAVFIKMMKKNRANLFLATLPYKIGIVTAVSAGLLSFPFIFELNHVAWFNETFVTSGLFS